MLAFLKKKLCRSVTFSLVAILFVGVIGVWGFGAIQTTSVDKVDLDNAADISQTQLLVSAQSNSDEVKIHRTTLVEPGYVVLREIIERSAGQIVEISQYFDAGIYHNIKIPLGEFYTGENELMALIYTDAENDKVFNDLDQPFVDNNGDFVARSVKTGKVVPNEIIESESVDLSMMSDVMRQTIRYTNEGFKPSRLEVEVGTMVHFVNESDMEMWVASDSHPTHDILPTFDQFKPGDMFVYVFDDLDTWEYHDHLNPFAVGEIIVK